MASSAILSTSISVLVSTFTSLSTVWSTSNPVLVTTLISIASQFSILTLPTTVTQAGTVMASTVAFPVTTTQTLSQVLTSYSPQYPTPPSTSTVTSTVTSTIVQPGQTYTYYAPTPTLVTTTFVLTPAYPTAQTTTVTELIFFLENAIGEVYSTITTTLPSNTNSFVIVSGKDQNDESDSGWESWNDSQKGGLVAGVILAFLLLLLVVILLIRCSRRNVWVASDSAGMAVPYVQTTPGNALVVAQTPQAYWGPGPSGWGIRG